MSSDVVHDHDITYALIVKDVDKIKDKTVPDTWPCQIPWSFPIWINTSCCLSWTPLEKPRVLLYGSPSTTNVSALMAPPFLIRKNNNVLRALRAGSEDWKSKNVGRSSNFDASANYSKSPESHGEISGSSILKRLLGRLARTLPRKFQLLMQNQSNFPVYELRLLYRKSTTKLQYVHVEPKLGQDLDHIITQFKHPSQQVSDCDGCAICMMV